MKKFIVWSVIIVCSFGLGFLVFNLLIMPFIGGGGKDIAVPNLIGKPMVEAQRIILTQGLGLGNAREVFDTIFPHSYVVGQKPLAGSTVRSGRNINLIISKGPQIVRMPFLEQMTLDQGLRILTGLGIKPTSIESLRSLTIPAGKIIGLEPGPGSDFALGNRLRIFVSGGSSGVFLMPQLVGLPTSEAVDSITYNGLMVGGIQVIPSDEIEGLVIIQYPEQGMRVKTGDEVRIIVSQGRR